MMAKNILTGLALAVCLFGCSGGDSDAVTGCAETGCPDDSVCYDSQSSGPGSNGAFVVGKQEGDLQCHLKCENDSDCVQGEVCKKVEMHGSDLYWLEQFCLAE